MLSRLLIHCKQASHASLHCISQSCYIGTHPLPSPQPVEYSCAVCREESDPRYIQNAADVKLRSFTTKVCTASMSLVHACTLNQIVVGATFLPYAQTTCTAVLCASSALPLPAATSRSQLLCLDDSASTLVARHALHSQSRRCTAGAQGGHPGVLQSRCRGMTPETHVAWTAPDGAALILCSCCSSFHVCH